MAVLPGGDLWTGSELGSLWVWPADSIAEAMEVLDSRSQASENNPSWEGSGRHAQVMQAGGKELLATRRRDGAISGGALTGATVGLQQDPGPVRYLLHVPGTLWVWAGIGRQVFLWDIRSLTLQRILQLDRTTPAAFVTHHIPAMSTLYGSASGYLEGGAGSPDNSSSAAFASMPAGGGGYSRKYGLDGSVEFPPGEPLAFSSQRGGGGQQEQLDALAGSVTRGGGRRSESGAGGGGAYASLGMGGGGGGDADGSSRMVQWDSDGASPMYSNGGKEQEGSSRGGGGVAGGGLSGAGAKMSQIWSRARKGVEKFSSDALARVDSSGSLNRGGTPGGGGGTAGGGGGGVVRGLFAGIVGAVTATFAGAAVTDVDSGLGSGRYYGGGGEYGYGYGVSQSPVSARGGGLGHGGDIGSITCAVAGVDGGVWGGFRGGHVACWDAEGSLLRLHESPLSDSPASMGPDFVSSICCVGGHVWAGHASGRVRVFSIAAGVEIGRWQAHPNGEAVASIATTGRLVFTRGDDGSVRMWEAWAPLKPQIGQHVRGALASAATSYVKPCDFRLFATTWNVCVEHPPLSSISTWLRGAAGCQLVVVGLQEVETGAGSIVMATAKETVGGIGLLQGNSSVAEWWLDSISSVLREQGSFQRVASRQLAGIVIGVWVHTNVMHLVGDVSTGAVACGLIGRTLGNKGAVAARLRVNGRSLLLINSHLSAHLENVARRNADYDHICSKLVVRESGNEPLPLTACPAAPLGASYQDFLLWMGDFNYRIGNLSYEAVKRAIQQKDLEYLVANDQLLLERAAGRAFVGMQEAPITFAPTYKFDKGVPGMAYDSSEKRRVPAWCDRILYQESKRPIAGTSSNCASNNGGNGSTPDASHYGSSIGRDASSHGGANPYGSTASPGGSSLVSTPEKQMRRLSVSQPGVGGGAAVVTDASVSQRGGGGVASARGGAPVVNIPFEGALPAVNVVDGPLPPLDAKVERYDCVADVCDSDHKAVIATFCLKLHLVDEAGRRRAFRDALANALQRWERPASATTPSTTVSNIKSSGGGRQPPPPDILCADLLGLGSESLITVESFPSGPSQPTSGAPPKAQAAVGGVAGASDARTLLSAARLFLWPLEPPAMLIVTSREPGDCIIFEVRGRDCRLGPENPVGAPEGGGKPAGSARSSFSGGARGGGHVAVVKVNPRHTPACAGGCPGGGLPSWLRITPLGGMLGPGESKALELTLMTDELSNSRGGTPLGALGDDQLELSATLVVHFRREWCELDRWSQEFSVVLAQSSR